MIPLYTVTATRSGRWWAIDVPELFGVHTQCRRRSQIADTARSAIAETLDIDPTTFDVTVEVTT